MLNSTEIFVQFCSNFIHILFITFFSQIFSSVFTLPTLLQPSLTSLKPQTIHTLRFPLNARPHRRATQTCPHRLPCNPSACQPRSRAWMWSFRTRRDGEWECGQPFWCCQEVLQLADMPWHSALVWGLLRRRRGHFGRTIADVTSVEPWKVRSQRLLPGLWGGAEGAAFNRSASFDAAFYSHRHGKWMGGNRNYLFVCTFVSWGTQRELSIYVFM